MKKSNRLVLILLFLSLNFMLSACQSKADIVPAKLRAEIAKKQAAAKKSEQTRETTTSSAAKAHPFEKSQDIENFDKTVKGLPEDANHAKNDKIYATGNAKVYYYSNSDGFEAQIPDFKGYSQDKVKAVLGKPESVLSNQNQIVKDFKKKELNNLRTLFKEGSITEEQTKAFYAAVVDLAQAAKFGGTNYTRFTYDSGKVQLIFDKSGMLYYITPNPNYLYFK